MIYTKEIPTSEFVYPQKNVFFSILEKIPQCWQIKLYYLSSGMLKYNNFSFVLAKNKTHTDKRMKGGGGGEGERKKKKKERKKKKKKKIKKSK